MRTSGPQVSQEYNINKSRTVIADMEEKVSQNVHAILEMSAPEQVRRKVRGYFEGKRGYEALGQYFDANPSAFIDLLRKVVRYRQEITSRNTYNGTEITTHTIEESDKNDCLSVLLRNRKGKEVYIQRLKGELYRLLGSEEFIQYARKQPSILDSSGYSFAYSLRRAQPGRSKGDVKKSPAQISPSENENHLSGDIIKRLIFAGLAQNIPDFKEVDANEHFQKVYPIIIRYFHEIFGKDFSDNPIGRAKNIESLERLLLKAFWSENAQEIEDAWRIIQSFFPWGNAHIVEEEREQNAEKQINQIVKYVQGHGASELELGEIRKVGLSYRKTGSTMLNRKRYAILFRTKDPKSDAQKRWQKIEYINNDAIRDTIGVAIPFGDDASHDDKMGILQFLAGLFPHGQYYLDNQGCFDAGFEKELIGKYKPLIVDSRVASTSTPEFLSFSASGFILLQKDPHSGEHVGCEGQGMSESTKKWKDVDDPSYKIRSAIDALVRGPNYLNPSEVEDLVYVRMKKNLSDASPDGHVASHRIRTETSIYILQGITTGELIPYILGNEQVVFTNPQKERHFKAAFETAQKIDVPKSDVPKSNTSSKGDPEKILTELKKKFKPITGGSDTSTRNQKALGSCIDTMINSISTRTK